jgi:hypothetical protein
MPRPKSKDELISLSQKNFRRLLDFIDGMSNEEQEKEFPKGTMNRNIRDVLAHLHHWHLMMLDWYALGMQGQKPDMPAKGYTWKSTPQLNKRIWEKYADAELTQIRILFESSFKQVYEIILKHSNEELFQKKRYKWTGSTSLAAYLISATSSHYDWAYKLIKKAKK